MSFDRESLGIFSTKFITIIVYNRMSIKKSYLESENIMIQVINALNAINAIIANDIKFYEWCNGSNDTGVTTLI